MIWDAFGWYGVACMFGPFVLMFWDHMEELIYGAF